MLNTNTGPLGLTADSKRLRTLYTVSAALNQITAGLDMNRILPEVLRASVDALEADTGSIFVLDYEYELKHIYSIDGEEEYSNLEPTYLEHIRTKGLAGRVIRNGQPILVQDTNNDDRWLSEGSKADINMSAICIPLQAYGRVSGVITLTKIGINQFENEDVTLLQAICELASTAISNAQLYHESQRQTESLQVLINAGVQISASLNVENVIHLVAEQVVRLVQVESCAIMELNPHNNELIGRALYTRESKAVVMPQQDQIRIANSTLVQDILIHPRPVQMSINDSQLERAERFLLQRLGLSSMMLVALRAPSPSQSVGLAVLMEKSTPRTYRDDQISMVQTLCNQAATAIQNARLYEETQRQLRITKLLNETSQVINSSLDLDRIMQSLLTQVNSFLQVEALSIALVDTMTNELVFTVAEGLGSQKIVGMRLPTDRGVAGWVVEHGESAMVNDTGNDPRFSSSGDNRTGHKTYAIIVAPLRVKGNVLGTIQAVNPINQPYFTQEDMNLLENLANLASSAVGNAQQYILTQKAEARYIGLFQDSIDPIVLTDKAGAVIDINGAASELFGYSRDEMLKLHINDLHTVDTGVGVLGERQFKPIKTRQIKMFSSEITSQKSGKITVVEVYAKRIFVNANDDRISDRQVLQWIYHDITEQIELQQMREDLTAMLFHDLRSPLGNIIASLELVSDELPHSSSPAVVNMVDVAVRSSQRLQRLIHSLLDINRLEAGHTIQNQSFTSISRLIDDTEETLKASFERRNVSMARQLPIFIPDIYVDADMVRRVIINLVDNALK
ncbi:MAG: GAF domain-containing protein, partial [Chloroflexota bacterium]